MKTAKDVLKSIKDNDVKYVDLRFTDPRGKWQHVTFDTGMIDDDVFAEGLMFDDVRFQTTPYNTGFKLDSSELPINSDTEYEGGNLGHRIRTKAGYFPVPPQDSVQDMRSEMLGAMAKMGVKVEKHHHEVAS